MNSALPGYAPDSATSDAEHDREPAPPGVRMDVVTWRVLDRSGAIRAHGVTSEARARAEAQRLADAEFGACAPLSLVRRHYVAFTHDEVVELIDATPEPEARLEENDVDPA